jgi:hypothetical protein
MPRIVTRGASWHTREAWSTRLSLEETMQLDLSLTAPAIIAGLTLASSAIFANMISFIMIGKINKRVVESERISYFWWGNQVRRKFKHFYPDSKLTLLLNLCVVLMFVSFAILVRVWVFGAAGAPFRRDWILDGLD